MTPKKLQSWLFAILLLFIQAHFMAAQAQSTTDATKARRWSVGAIATGSLSGFSDSRAWGGRRLFSLGATTAVHFRVAGPIYLIGGLRFHQGGFAFRPNEPVINLPPSPSYDVGRYRVSSINLCLGAGGAFSVSNRLRLGSEVQIMNGVILRGREKYFFRGKNVSTVNRFPENYARNTPFGTIAVGAKINMGHGLRLDLMPYYERDLNIEKRGLRMNGMGIQAGVFYTL